MATTSKKSPAKTGKGLKNEPATKRNGSVNINNTHSVELQRALQEHFGFDSFKGNQEAIILNVLNGKDTFVIKPTGGGKSLCYQLPAILSEGVAIIVSPLIALMKNQVDLVRSYRSKDDVGHFLNSTLTKKQIREVGPRTRSEYTQPAASGNISRHLRSDSTTPV